MAPIQARKTDIDTAKPPSGQEILLALREELINNLYKLPSSTIAPTVFHVYLHQEDFDTLEGIVPRIVSELASALTQDVERLNADALPHRLLPTALRKPAAALIEVPASGWDIYIQPDLDGDIPRGAFGIVSKLTIPTRPELTGAPTVRTVRTVVADGQRTSVTATLRPAAPTAALPAPVPTSAIVAIPAAASVATPPTVTRRNTPRAVLSYTDDAGTHRFPMQKDAIKIGRGGSGTWVDLQLVTGAKVSREHCWIRCDEAGRLFIRDTSTWGTSVNGRPIAGPRRSANGDVVEPGPEEALPADAAIGLADTVMIQLLTGSQS